MKDTNEMAKDMSSKLDSMGANVFKAGYLKGLADCVQLVLDNGMGMASNFTD